MSNELWTFPQYLILSDLRDNVYKFKHNITKRFSQEGRHKHHNRMQHSDFSSSSSSHEQEDEQRKHKWKGESLSSVIWIWIQ